MEPEEYKNIILAIEALSRLLETLIYQGKEYGISLIDLRNNTEDKLKELISKL
jgi:hypothetical protein